MARILPFQPGVIEVAIFGKNKLQNTVTPAMSAHVAKYGCLFLIGSFVFHNFKINSNYWERRHVLINTNRVHSSKSLPANKLK